MGIFTRNLSADFLFTEIFPTDYSIGRLRKKVASCMLLSHEAVAARTEGTLSRQTRVTAMQLLDTIYFPLAFLRLPDSVYERLFFLHWSHAETKLCSAMWGYLDNLREGAKNEGKVGTGKERGRDKDTLYFTSSLNCTMGVITAFWTVCCIGERALDRESGGSCTCPLHPSPAGWP